jgi:UDP-N-acetylmuramoyl-tripeptide--D-alanyl-D-alanine ligase
MSLFTAAMLDAMPGFQRLTAPGVAADFRAVSTDSRSIAAGALFVPLIGPNFDGHAFLHEVVAKGAAGAIVSHVPAELPPIPVWKVDDTLVALGDLARSHRDKFRIPVLGLTGTSGKTTTKEILRQMFSQRRLLVNEGNFNNLIGVPLTIFGMGAQHEFAVLEMGMNQFGEIGRLTQIANPTVGLINNVGPGHLEGVGDLEGVLRAKTEMARELAADAPLVLNADDPLLRRFGQGAQRKIIWFGLQLGSEVTATDVDDRGLEGISFTLKMPAGEARVHLRLAGEHNLRNTLGAAAAAAALGLPFEEIVAGVGAVAPFKMRNEILTGPQGSTILSDCYNANPASTSESLRLLRTCKATGRIAAVLGDMLELGGQTEKYHAEIGKLLGAIEPDRAWVVGKQAGTVVRAAGRENITVADNRDELAREVGAWLQAGDTLLVKGSRGMRLETLVASLRGKGSGH